ncbi:MAG: hypothetical protein AAF513_13760 [Pseudomonadota bacterium]
MGKTTIEKVAGVLSVVVLVAAVGFWAYQVTDVIEVLRLAYG